MYLHFHGNNTHLKPIGGVCLRENGSETEAPKYQIQCEGGIELRSLPTLDPSTQVTTR